MQKPIILSILALFLFLSTATAQEEIKLINPSFEGTPTLSKGPKGWVDCGFPGESAADVHPVSSSDFGVTQEAMDGKTYLGMVVRDNDTWEAVSQYLSSPFQADSVYSFSLYLARSAMYLSRSRKTNEGANYSTPTILRIWGGNGACDKAELLAETKAIINTEWLKYEYEFSPSQAYTYITLEAFYRVPVLFPYNGNLLLDNCSSIQLLSGRTADSVERPEIDMTKIASLEEMNIKDDFIQKENELGIRAQLEIINNKFKKEEDIKATQLLSAIIECSGQGDRTDRDIRFVKENMDFQEFLSKEGIEEYLIKHDSNVISKRANDLISFDDATLNEFRELLIKIKHATSEEQPALLLKYKMITQRVIEERLIEKEVLAFIEWNKGKLLKALENCPE